jgi:hypothetical protein
VAVGTTAVQDVALPSSRSTGACNVGNNILFETGTAFMIAGSSVVVVGIVVYLIRSRIIHEWPFEQ